MAEGHEAFGCALCHPASTVKAWNGTETTDPDHVTSALYPLQCQFIHLPRKDTAHFLFICLNWGNTVWAKRTAFTRSAITPPKVNRFGWNLNSVCQMLTDFGRDPHSSEFERQPKFCRFLVLWITHDDTDFLSDNFTTFEHNNVDQWGGENIRNRILKILQ